MELYFATTNSGKVRSLQRVLPGVDVVQAALQLPEPRSDDLRLIAREKVLEAYRVLGKPVVANDSGFYIHSLNGFPRAFVNFALETIGLEGMLALASGKPRECEFRQCLAYYDSSLGEPMFFESVTPGVLAPEQRGEAREGQWSDLFLVFIPSGETKTLAEMSEEEFDSWRERRDEISAMARFAEWYTSQ